jgi:TIR domain-containing protein
MADDETGPATESVPLYVLLLGASPALEQLYGELAQAPEVRHRAYVDNVHYAWGEIRSGRVNTIIIEPQTVRGEADAAVLTIFQIRQEFPEIALVLLIDDLEFDRIFAHSTTQVRTRLSHYFRLHPTRIRYSDGSALKSVLHLCRDWHSTLIEQRPYTKRFRYDVAISFAGEDRSLAQQIAEILRAHDVRVFFDSFEQADLWGKDLFTHLHDIYSNQSRFCLMLISRHYAEKMWTVHERRSAQERVLNERDHEYLLPVRIDDTPLPGLPTQIGYLNANSGAPAIAQLFVRKLGGVLGTLSKDRSAVDGSTDSRKVIRIVNLPGEPGSDARSSSSWISLSPRQNLRRGQQLRLILGSSLESKKKLAKIKSAKIVLVRFLRDSDDANEPIGIVTPSGIAIPDGKDRAIEITIPADFDRTRIISIHGGPEPFNVCYFGADNGSPPRLIRAELVEAAE